MRENIKKYYFLIVMIFISYYITIIPKYNATDWDLWARLAVGKIFFQTGHVLLKDIFAYTAVKSIWIDHEWGAGVIFYGLVHLFGDFGLLLLKCSILFFIFIFVFETNQLRQNNTDRYRLSYYFLFFFSILPTFDNTIRCQCFTYFFFALWIYLLDLVKSGKTTLIWIFPITMLLWSNIHGGFPAGIGIVLVYTIGEAINAFINNSFQIKNFFKYFFILISSILVTLINPYGIKYWYYIAGAATMPRPFIAEWSPLNLFGSIHQVTGFKILLILAILSGIYFIYNSISQGISEIKIKNDLKSVNWTVILVLLTTFYMSMEHIRHTMFFVIASASYLYYYAYPALDWITYGMVGKIYAMFSPKARSIGKISRDIMIYTVLVIYGMLVILVVPRYVFIDDVSLPTNAVKFIQMNKISGNLLVLFNWGSYALWKLYPQDKIAVDGRYEEVYKDSFIDEVARFHYVGVNWDDLLTKYHTDAMLIPLDYKDLFNRVCKLKDWTIIYQDKTAAVFFPKAKNKLHWIKIPKNFNPAKDKFQSSININNI